MISMLRRIIVTGLALGALAACSPQGENGPGAGFTGTDITGAQYGQSLKLTDHNGAVRTLADYKGKVVTIFFGYTQCPDVCPTNLVNMAEAMRQLGPDSDKVQVLFVTVDPERDTQELLAQYVPAFDPRFVGLLGDAATTAAVPRISRSSTRSRVTRAARPTPSITPPAPTCSTPRAGCGCT